jgi:hypothetical protein
MASGNIFEARHRERARSARAGYLLLTGFFAVVISVAGWEKRRTPSAPLVHEAYVWQRSWDAALGEAVTEAGAHLSGMLVLAGEMAVENGRFTTRHIPVNHDALRRARGGATAVVRLFPSIAAGGWSAEAKFASDKFLREIVEEWSHRHPYGIGLQIDFDCPEKRLADFHEQMLRWKLMFPEVEITFTALPTWLNQDEFTPLARDFPHYVLQVHSLHLPGKTDGWVGLCNPVEIRSSILSAAEAGVPYRLALPTYSCLVVFDEGGGVAEVYGEDIPDALPLGALDSIALDSDPHMLSSLLREWERSRPRPMEGIVWYRLPASEDRLNWNWALLNRVITGQPLVRQWSLHAEPDPGGYHRLILRNEGNAPDDLPRHLRLRVANARAVGSDGLVGFLPIEPSTANTTTGATFDWELAEPLRHFQKPPGWSGVVGWCRWQGGSGPPISTFPNR